MVDLTNERIAEHHAWLSSQAMDAAGFGSYDLLTCSEDLQDLAAALEELRRLREAVRRSGSVDAAALLAAANDYTAPADPHAYLTPEAREWLRRRARALDHPTPDARGDGRCAGV